MKKMAIKIGLLLAFFNFLPPLSILRAQVAINRDGSAPDDKAILDLKSTDRGLLIPRMTTEKRTGMAGLSIVQKGLLVYDTDLNAVWQFNGTTWVEVGATPPPTASVWTTLNPTTIYTDKQKVGINNTDPKAALHVNGQTAINTDASAPSPKAQLDVKSKTKGMHIPRMTSAERIAIAPSASDVGMIVFDLDKTRLYVFDGQGWMPLAVSNSYETLLTKRMVSDPNENDGFGYSVSLSGEYAIVGAPLKPVTIAAQGAAYIYYRTGSTWTEQAKLVASDPVYEDLFGCSVSISGDYVIVGAYTKDSRRGAAYIFYRTGSTWTQQAKLTASDGVAGDHFGLSVSISGDYAIVGAYHKTVGGNVEQGAAYIFNRTGTSWSQQAKLTGSNGAASDNFGNSVSISGTNAFVGAFSKNIGGRIAQGAVYSFSRSGSSWSQQQMLTGSDQSSSYFGTSVFVSGTYAIVGSPAVNQTGGAYVYYSGGSSFWGFQYSLTAPDGAANDNFGGSVCITDGYAIVGASKKNLHQGVAYIFKQYIYENPWGYMRTLTNTVSGSRDSNFGAAVGITPNACLIGEPLGETNPSISLRVGKVLFGVIDF